MPFQFELTIDNVSYFTQALLELISIQALFNTQADRAKEEFLALNCLYEYFLSNIEHITDQSILNDIIHALNEFIDELQEDSTAALTQLNTLKANLECLLKETCTTKERLDEVLVCQAQFNHINTEFNNNIKAKDISNSFLSMLKNQLQRQLSSAPMVLSIAKKDFVFIKNKTSWIVAGVHAFLRLCTEMTVPVNVASLAEKDLREKFSTASSTKLLKKAVNQNMKSLGTQRGLRNLIALPREVRQKLLTGNIKDDQSEDDDNPSQVNTIQIPPPIPPAPLAPMRSAPQPPAPPVSPALDSSKLSDLQLVAQRCQQSYLPKFSDQELALAAQGSLEQGSSSDKLASRVNKPQKNF